MKNSFDTICAIATPLSAGGVGIIRVSGEKSLEIVQKFFSRKIVPNVINHGWIVNDGANIDEVVVLYFKNPKSFTGEDVVEVQTHGSPIVIKEVLNLLLCAGVRLAERGEFTKRAFLNHKIDMTQAEAVLDLICAKTQKAAHLSANNLSGFLKQEINKIRVEIIEILAKIIASLDFPDDVAEVSNSDIENALTNSIFRIENILKNANTHNILREGAKVAIVGQPNVGKSSLFNALLSLQRAIVTDIAGTTRDIIAETLDVNGIAVTIIDTAGIREDESMDLVEQIGISNAKETLAQADLALCLYDGLKGLCEKDESIFKLCPDRVQKLIVSTKADLAGREATRNALCEDFVEKFEPAIIQEADISAHGEHLNVSAVTLYGIEELKRAIFDKIIGLNQTELEFSTNQRQQECLRKGKAALENALSEARLGQLHDLISIDIKSALLALDEITGELVTEEILTHVFERFCIGK
ncbi:tRNA modification GTPase [Candidatus Gastranaerophilus sp. (ex Termes propinquus)]|nr:tRNA modification GTPase [Candidatus Gastranaerophilus sp. (ex Termes propinquus)]